MNYIWRIGLSAFNLHLKDTPLAADTDTDTDTDSDTDADTATQLQTSWQINKHQSRDKKQQLVGIFAFGFSSCSVCSVGMQRKKSST